MSGVIIAGNTSGSVTLDAPAVSGSTVITLPTASGTMVATDTSGNVGIGVTPSAWGSGYKAIQINSGASIMGDANNYYAFANAYFDGTNFKYINSNYALNYRMSGGTHNWHVAASGTAGNNITFTQAMTLDASGNIQLGTTSAGAIVPAMSIVRGGTTWQLGPSVPTGGGNTFYILNSANLGVYLPSGNTAWSASSDERVKDIIEPIENAAEKVSTLRAVIGKFKSDEEGTRRAFLIAQDVQAVLPEAVNVQDDEQGTLGVQYTDVIPLLVAAIKEQQALITSLTARLDALENK